MKDLYTLNEITVYYSHKQKMSDQYQIMCSKNVYDLVINDWMIDIDYRESFKVLLLTRSNKVLGIANLFKGGISGVIVDVKMIYQVALTCNASGIILMHNHPSGNLKASAEDMKLTNKVIEVGKVMDLPVLDHLIVTSESYLSMADKGLV